VKALSMRRTCSVLWLVLLQRVSRLPVCLLHRSLVHRVVCLRSSAINNVTAWPKAALVQFIGIVQSRPHHPGKCNERLDLRH
jgi:hypothetical protein